MEHSGVVETTSASWVAEAGSQARRILLGNGGQLGLLGCRTAYQQVWARDSMICALGLLLCGGRGIEIHRRSLATLRRFQSLLGKVPHNVGGSGIEDPALIAHGGKLAASPHGEVAVEDTIHAGCVDSNLWYIVGHYAAYAVTGELQPLEEAWPSLERSLLWLRYQDSNECGLLEVHEAMDWADLFANRYNVLYDNVLYSAAWKCMAQMAQALGRPSIELELGAADVRRKLNALLWVGPEEPKDWDWIASTRREWLYTLKRIENELVERPFYLPYVAFRDYADRIDVLGNLLAILFGVADAEKTAKILDYIAACGLDAPHPVRCVYPTVDPRDPDWREYYRVRNLNLPHHYHNGGAWPFIGGFYVAALVRAGRRREAEVQLSRLAAMNRLGRTREWGFNEWFHGVSGQPMGFDGQSWSAALYIYAAACVERGQVDIFTAERGWGTNRKTDRQRTEDPFDTEEEKTSRSVR